MEQPLGHGAAAWPNNAWSNNAWSNNAWNNNAWSKFWSAHLVFAFPFFSFSPFVILVFLACYGADLTMASSLTPILSCAKTRFNHGFEPNANPIMRQNEICNLSYKENNYKEKAHFLKTDLLSSRLGLRIKRGSPIYSTSKVWSKRILSKPHLSERFGNGLKIKFTEIPRSLWHKILQLIKDKKPRYRSFRHKILQPITDRKPKPRYRSFRHKILQPIRDRRKSNVPCTEIHRFFRHKILQPIRALSWKTRRISRIDYYLTRKGWN